MRNIIGALILGFILFSFSQKTVAQDPSAVAEVRRGDALLADPNNKGYAIYAYNEAKRIAADKRDWNTMLWVSSRYLLLGDQWHANDSLNLAYAYAYDWAIPNATRSGSGEGCTYGRSGLRTIVSYWNSTLKDMSMSSSTASSMLYTAQQAFNTDQWLTDKYGATGCAPQKTQGQSGVYATAGNNSLADGFPTRGFGDSTQVDVWVPFSFNTSWNFTGYKLKSISIVFKVKPIDQLIGTDGLILKGASGKGYTVYDSFHLMTAKQWNEAEVEVTEPDILRAVLSGKLEGVIQDDSAVEWVYLRVNVEQ